MKIAYIGIDLFAPALEILLSEGCELLELFTCRTDNLTEFNSKVISIAQNAGVPYKLDRITIADFVRIKEKGCEAVILACTELSVLKMNYPTLHREFVIDAMDVLCEACITICGGEIKGDL